MTEETEVAQEGLETQEAQVQDENRVENTTEATEQPKKADSDHNWKQATETLKSQKREIEELKAHLAQLAKPKEPEEVDEFADLDPNDYLTVDKARELGRKIAKKEAEAAAKKLVAEYQQQQSLTSDEARCRSKYEDYDYIIENFAIPQINNDPALAYKIQNSKNPAEVAYKIGKLSDSYEESMTKQQTSPKAEKIMKNVNRPLSGSAANSSLKNQADQYAKMSRAEVWEMSQKYARGA